jgi:hypothetical protein
MSETSSRLVNSSELLWAPSLANGAAVLALAGVVGNVPHPDRALSALTPSLGMFGLGLLLGCASLNISAEVHGQLRRMVRNAERASELASGLHAAAQEGDDTRRAALVAQLPDGEATLGDMRKALGAVSRLQNWPGRLNAASLFCCALGFATLLIGHAAGLVRLEG